LENLIQWAKSTVRYRTTKYPELVLANDILLDDAIARCCARHASVRDALGEWEHVDVVGSTFSCPDVGSSDGSQLLGKGRDLGAAARADLGVDAAVERFVETFQPAGWSVDMVEQASILLYTYAQAQGGELLHSTQYTRARSRVSYNVLCQFWEGGLGVDSSDAVQEPTYYAGKIAYFVKIVAPAAMDLDGAVEEPAVVPDLRLAVMDLHLLQRLDREIGVMYHSVTYCSGIPTQPSACLLTSRPQAQLLASMRLHWKPERLFSCPTATCQHLEKMPRHVYTCVVHALHKCHGVVTAAPGG
jgi:hypothetical protein